VLGITTGGVERGRFTTAGGYLVGSWGLGTITAPRTVLDVGGIGSFKSCFEDANIAAIALTGVLAVDVLTNALVICTSNASGNFSFNIRGNSSTTLDSIMAAGQSLTLAIEVPQGATPYYCTAVTVDGSPPAEIKWFGASGAPTAGNTSGIDVYAVTVIKTGAATFKVRASQAQMK
jgi:hypothetical protein